MKSIRIGYLVLTLTLTLTLVLLLAACANRDLPPDPGTPEPPPLNGSYVSRWGTLTFNGDGETVILELSQELSEAMGFPAGEQEGSYVFLFHHAQCRYDTAESVRFSVSGVDYQTLNRHGETNEDAIVFQSPLAEDEWLRFERNRAS